MELFLPSVIVLLLAAAVVFFVFPRFGPATLAIISAILLAFGLYQHYTTFGTEYRFSTWQMVSFAPYLLVGGLLVVIAAFLLYTLPVGAAAANTVPNVPLPTVEDMPPANTSTNMLTQAINKTLNTANNLFNNANKGNNNILKTLGSYIPGTNGNSNSNYNRNRGFPFSQI